MVTSRVLLVTCTYFNLFFAGTISVSTIQTLMSISIFDPQTSITMISSSSSQADRNALTIRPSSTQFLTDTVIQQTPSSQVLSVDTSTVLVTSLPFQFTQPSTRQLPLGTTISEMMINNKGTANTGLIVGLVFLFLILMVLVTIFVLLLIIYLRKRNDKKRQGKNVLLCLCLCLNPLLIPM